MKKLAGQIIQDHMAKELDFEDDIIEYRRLMEPTIMKEIRDTAKKSARQDQYLNKDFYIVLKTIQDRMLMQPRWIVLARQSCPTPVYKDSVWKYYHKTGTLEFLWTLPDALLYHSILKNKTKYLADKETAEITKFCILNESGELLRWVIKENGEDKKDAIIYIKEKHD